MGNTLKIQASTALGYGACKTVLKIIDLNPWIELIVGGSILAVIYLFSVILTGALSTKNLKDIKTITDRYQPTRWILDPIFTQLIRIAKE